MKELPTGVTLGDPAGIGPEIVAKMFAEPGFHQENRAVVVGDQKILERAVRLLGLPLRVNVVSEPGQGVYEPGDVDLVPASELPEDLPFGELDGRAGAAAYEYVRRAVELAQNGEIRAIATAPLNKEALHRAGLKYPGHTEILAELTSTKDYAMMLVAEELRVIHVSTHVSLAVAIDRVRRERELIVIRLAYAALRKIGVEEPRIAVAGLNPVASPGTVVRLHARPPAAISASYLATWAVPQAAPDTSIAPPYSSDDP
ncbi:MAG: 4-hydroxythreonine-4-phosphate dehydrogenase PdxA, partial [Rubrobacter sp.]|nr:4-hydroxythreonine-4-phosphate dehydrogenase PdxA [Rubrobacter sp.]